MVGVALGGATWTAMMFFLERLEGWKRGFGENLKAEKAVGLDKK